MIEHITTRIPRGGYLIEWRNMKANDEGQPITLESRECLSVMADGIFATGTALISGTNYLPTDESQAFILLNDHQGNPLKFERRGLEKILENCTQIKPSITGGNASTLISIALLIENAQG